MKNILIIDDSKAVRDFLKENISPLICDKCKIIEAKNGLEGIKLAKEYKPDIVFIDVNMPILNGYITAIRIKNLSGLEKSVLIAMTGETDHSVQRKMLALCDDFIPKPIDKDSLTLIVKNYLKEVLKERKNKIDRDSFDEITNEIALSLEEKVEELTRLNRELKNRNNIIESLYREADKAKKKLEALINFRQNFLDFIFHEIKGPLSSILGYSEILQIKYYTVLNEEGNGYIENIVGSTERIKTLMEQLSKFNTFDFEIKGKNFIRVFKAIDEVLLRYKDFIVNKRLRIYMNVSKDLKMKINKAYLIEIVDPIIRNAIIFNKDKGLIDIIANKKDESIVIEIKDSGIGMTEDQIEQAFTPFVQFIDVEHYKTHKLKGLGLGLATCKKMVELARGGVKIESAKNKGTRVIIELPEIV